MYGTVIILILSLIAALSPYLAHPAQDGMWDLVQVDNRSIWYFSKKCEKGDLGYLIVAPNELQEDVVLVFLSKESSRKLQGKRLTQEMVSCRVTADMRLFIVSDGGKEDNA